MIGIIGAMEEEVAELKKDMQIEETVEMAGMVFCKGTLGGKDVGGERGSGGPFRNR